MWAAEARKHIFSNEENLKNLKLFGSYIDKTSTSTEKRYQYNFHYEQKKQFFFEKKSFLLDFADPDFLSILQSDEKKKLSQSEIIKLLIFFMKKHDAQTHGIPSTPFGTSMKYLFSPRFLTAIHKTFFEPNQGTPSDVKPDDLINLKYTLSQFLELRIVPNMFFSNGLEKNLTTTTIELNLFSHLRKLVLYRVKPNLIADFELISQRVYEIEVFDILNALDELLGFFNREQRAHFKSETFEQQEDELIKQEQHPHGGNIKMWKNLKILNCSFNNIPSVDYSLCHLHNVEKIDFSFNLISQIQNFQYCYNLVILNLSHNLISDLSNICQYLGNLKCLILSSNRITSAKGLERLFALEICDLSYNLLPNLSDVFFLKELPFLQSVAFEGNPFSQNERYRFSVFTMLSPNLKLDGEEPSTEELFEISKENELKAKLVSSDSPSLKIRIQKSKKYPIKRVALIDDSTEFLVKHPEKKVLSPLTQQPAKRAEAFRAENKQTSGSLENKVPQYMQEYGNDWLIYLTDEMEQHESELKKESKKGKKKKEKTEEEIKKEQLKEWSLSGFGDHEKHPAKNKTASQEETTSPPEKNPEKPKDETTSKEVKAPAEESLKSKENTPTKSKETDPPQSPDSSPKIQKPEITRPKKEEVTGKAQSSPISFSRTERSNLPFPETFEEKRLTEEFYVQVQNGNELEDRILIIDSETLEEADIYAGSTMQKLELRQLIRVSQKKNSKSTLFREHYSYSIGFNNFFSTLRIKAANYVKVTIELEFRSSLIDTKDRLLCNYEVDESDADNLFHLLEPIAIKNRKKKHIRCIQCNLRHEFGNINDTATCRACSGYLIEYDSEKTSSLTNSFGETELASSKSPKSFEPSSATFSILAEKPEITTDDTNSLQIYLRLNILKGASEERFIDILETGFLYYGTPVDGEKKIALVLTNTHFYVLLPGKKQPDEDYAFSTLSFHKLADIQSVTLGYSYQLFQIRIEKKTFVFIPRDHEKCHKFINHLKRFQKEACCEHNLAPAPIGFKNNEYRKNIAKHIFNQNEEVLGLISIYAMVYHRQKTASGQGWNPLKSLVKMGASPISPKTLICVGGHLVLCEEDFANWPYVPSKASMLPQYKSKEVHNLADVIKIEFFESLPNHPFFIHFEIEMDSKKTHKTWELSCHSLHQTEFVIDRLANDWHQLFQVDLLVEKK